MPSDSASLDVVFRQCAALEEVEPSIARIEGVHGVAARGEHYTALRFDKNGRKLLYLTDRVANIVAEESGSSIDVSIMCPKNAMVKYSLRWLHSRRGKEIMEQVGAKQYANLRCTPGDLIMIIGTTYSPAFDGSEIRSVYDVFPDVVGNTG